VSKERYERRDSGRGAVGGGGEEERNHKVQRFVIYRSPSRVKKKEGKGT